MPSAALAFQWSGHTPYFVNLRNAFLPTCLFLSSRAFDGLSLAHQQVIRTAAAKLRGRLTDVSVALDSSLLGGLFEKQGTRPSPVSSTLRSDFLDEGRRVRARIGENIIPQQLIERVNGWLADFRAEHR